MVDNEAVRIAVAESDIGTIKDDIAEIKGLVGGINQNLISHMTYHINADTATAERVASLETSLHTRSLFGGIGIALSAALQPLISRFLNGGHL